MKEYQALGRIQRMKDKSVVIIHVKTIEQQVCELVAAKIAAKIAALHKACKPRI